MVTNLAEGVRAMTSNAFLVTGDRTVLVDAGASFDAVERVRDRDASLDAVVLTHTHPDHVGNLDDVKAAFGVEAWGFDPGQDGVDRAIADGDAVRLGDHDYTALHTPGHKDDHLCFYAADAGVLFSGDLVFQNGSFGRTDFEEGDRATLVASIDRLLDAIDGSLSAMYPGHGPSVTDDPRRHIELARQFAAQG
ncbi:MAG: MBL fold metallo-hydrolase [Halobacteriales archaeon]